MIDHQLSEYRQFRAPRDHGSALIDPPMRQVPNILAESAAVRDQCESRFGEMRRSARQRLIRDAVHYTSSYRDTEWASGRLAQDGLPSIVMSGHQPSMFHSGVWFKNFALDQIGRRQHAVPINLVIDNDVSAGVAVRVPTIDAAQDRIRMATVAFDSAGGGIPYEQSAIRDREYFAGFADRIRRRVAGLVDDPCVGDLWKHAVAATERCDIASCALAQARHGLEGELGLQTLEVPMSVVSRGYDFARFAIEILADASRFLSIYNDRTHHYRAAHGIRSSAHPVPNLRREGDWLEVPLWVYGDQRPQRRAVWVRRAADAITLSDRESSELTLDIRDRDRAAQAWAESAGPDWKLRPRALLTTMYARWILSDLFIHGIGGGKYDQLGDQIASQFFGIQPPPHLVMSATILLPSHDLHLPESSTLLDARRDLRRRIRDAQFQPERFDHPWTPEEQALVDEKRERMAAMPPHGQRARWHAEITRINRRLSESLDGRRLELGAELHAVESQLAERRIMDSREHPFCIFPIETITRTAANLLG